MQTQVTVFHAATTGSSFSPFLYTKCNFFSSARQMYASSSLKQLSNERVA